MFFTKKKFLSLSPQNQHKHAASLLKSIWKDNDFLLKDHYRMLEKWINLPSLIFSKDLISQRFHYHLRFLKENLDEVDLLPQSSAKDSPTNVPCLPVHIYLENLRSAFNVGSIIRTSEALRLGNIYFGGHTPTTQNKKVRETSMGTYHYLVCQGIEKLEDLPRPFIALETIKSAPSIFSFSFPSTFTLILGNEEYGIKNETLKQTDFYVQIPLMGWKNSLNVASAFAIAAAQIHKQLRIHPT